MTWAAAPADTQGITWIELCILFFLKGGNEQHLGLQVKSEGEPGHSIRACLLAFKRVARQVVQLYLEPFASVFFKPSKNVNLRLRCVGFTNHTACISGLPHLCNLQGKQVTKLVVGMRHAFTRNSNECFEVGNLELTSRKLSYRGVIPDTWRNISEVFPHDLGQVFQDICSHIVALGLIFWE